MPMTVELDIPDTAAMRALRTKLRDIHREIMIEFEKIDKTKEWTYSLKGITVKYDPRAAFTNDSE
jgi:hypothetical protein